MKAIVTALIASTLPLLCSAQEQQKQEGNKAKVETVHEHKGASHYHQHTVVPAERHTVTRWHYHKGYKRAGLPTAPAEHKEASAEKVDRKPTNK